jgi:hypothetical protein
MGTILSHQFRDESVAIAFAMLGVAVVEEIVSFHFPLAVAWPLLASFGAAALVLCELMLGWQDDDDEAPLSRWRSVAVGTLFAVVGAAAVASLL